MVSSGTSGWLFVLPWALGIGGVNEVVRSLIRCFHDGGVFFPYLLTTSEGAKPHGAAEASVVRAFCLGLWGPWDRRRPVRALLSFAFRLPSRCWKLRRIFNECNIRVVNPHFPGLGSLTFLILKALGQFDGKIVFTFHRGDIKEALATTGVERSLWRIMLRGADHIVVVSDDLGRDVVALEPKVAGKLRTIYNGVDLATFESAQRDRELLASDANSRQTVISVGAFIPRKGHDVLLGAFSRVVSRVCGARLVLVGETGPELARIRHLVSSMSLSERVQILEDVPHEQIPGYLARATLFALATRGEGYPLVIIEAGAAGLPVVCTRGSGLPELITDGVTGRLVEVDDEAALAEAMVDLLTHPEEARGLAENFHDRVKSNLTWQHTYRRYLELVAGASPPPTVPVAGAIG